MITVLSRVAARPSMASRATSELASSGAMMTSELADSEVPSSELVPLRVSWGDVLCRDNAKVRSREAEKEIRHPYLQVEHGK